MTYLFLFLTLLFGFVVYYGKVKLDDDFLSIKIYQKKYDLIKSRGLDYDDFMNLYYSAKNKVLLTFVTLTILSFLGVIFI